MPDAVREERDGPLSVKIRNALLDDAIFFPDLESDTFVAALRDIIAILYPERMGETKGLLLSRLLAAERMRSFDLGNGFAIPHLRISPDDRLDSRVGWFELKDGIQGASSSPIRLIACLIVAEDVADTMLAQAAGILFHPKFQQAVNHCGELHLFVAATKCLLQKPKRKARKYSGKVLPWQRELAVAGHRGLHCRVSAAIMTLIEGLDCNCIIRYEDTSVDARDFMDVMMLGAASGDKVHVTATGPDAEVALSRLEAILSHRFL